MGQPATIMPSVRERLASLLKLLLSTDKDGEALAAKNAINRTLLGAGLDLHALAGEIENPAGAAARRERPDKSPHDWREKLAHCDAREELLTPWEQSFIQSLRRWTGKLTERQGTCLDAIYERVKYREASQ